ncbi:MAG: Ig-like domain-containing protein [Gemmatimonadota bacterium]
MSAITSRIAVAGLVLLAACGGDTGGITPPPPPPPPPAVDHVVVDPTSATIKSGATQQVVSTAFNATGFVVSDATFAWTTSDATRAVVTQTGLVLGLDPGGPVTITATASGKSASTTLTIIPAEVKTIKVKPDTVEMLPGGTRAMILSAIDEFGNPVANPQAVWSSFNPLAATVDATGVVTGVALGESTISARIGNVIGQALVRVTPLAQARFRIEVTNNLMYSAEIMQNGVVVGTAGAQGSTTIERPLTPTLTLSWRLIPPLGRGETITETFPPILNPTGAVPLVIDNILNDGRVYFNPVLHNFSGKKARANFPVVVGAEACRCSITTNDNNQPAYGYWLLTPQSVLQVFGELDEALSGPFLSFPVLPGAVTPLSGVWQFNLLAVP